MLQALHRSRSDAQLARLEASLGSLLALEGETHSLRAEVMRLADRAQRTEAHYAAEITRARGRADVSAATEVARQSELQRLEDVVDDNRAAVREAQNECAAARDSELKLRSQVRPAAICCGTGPLQLHPPQMHRPPISGGCVQLHGVPSADSLLLRGAVHGADAAGG